MKFTITGKPISVNTAYPNRKGGGRRLSDDGISFKQDVGWMVKQAMNGRKMFVWPIRVQIDFYFDDDSHEVKARGLDRRNYRRDVDNGEKLILDAMTQIAYNDDSEVVNIELWKDFSDEPRIEVEITQL